METVKRLIARFSKWEYAGLLVLVLVTLVLHFSVIMTPDEPLFDEQYYVPDARLIIDGGGTERPEHPPLGKLFIVAGIELFGDNPIGWRFFSVISATTSIIFFYLICRRLNLSKRVSFLATFLIAFENLSFVHAGIALLDVYSLVFALAAFWLYLRGNYAMSGVAIALSALAKLNGALVLPVIGLHWFLTIGWTEVWQQLRFQLWFLTGREHRLQRFLLRFLWNGWLGAIFLSLAIWGTLALFVLGGSFGQGIIGNGHGLIGALRILGLYVLGVILVAPRQWRFLLSMLAVPITFIALMRVFDYAIWHKWLDPVAQIEKMLALSRSITNAQYPDAGSRPWEWIFTYPKVMEVMPYWWTPPYTGIISPTIWALIIPVAIYIIYKVIKGNTPVLLPFLWFSGTYLIWIPLSLITDRVTYVFYFYHTVGAICIGLAMVLFRLLDIAEARETGKLRWVVKLGVPFYLLLHLIAFIIITPLPPLSIVWQESLSIVTTPESIWWSIPLYLLLYIFTIRFLGLDKGQRPGQLNGIAIGQENPVD